MAYNEIVALGDTTAKKLKMENYMTQYILCKYKYIRKKIDLETIQKRRKVDFEKKHIFIDLKKKYTKKYNLQEFNKNTIKHLDEKTKSLYEKLDNLYEMQETAEDLVEMQEDMIDNIKKSKNVMFSVVNLVKTIDAVGGIGKINGISV